ncbi:cation:proton antiporter domain-containing protein [[Clostridium] polysaccharolyticum]|uniref:Sodium/proton antiporter, CPA1 family (TC 2.A.36) n=1 Tax=[Clostridium] polysaccharolyticum TaxID=29364 RepID=A0A1H9Y635_9FIRM|nr:cation:proton antiporter [[Clostridium] polysaccharolyticum]SES63878.1 sodium/proton antiporter, CPA1 family (TC 2.A.36) [[Clostridium] polysaccharolyticum]
MLTSFAFIFIAGLFFSRIFQKLKLPGLIGMILAGILIGPNLGNLLDKTILDIAPVLRQFALVIILTRAGLSLDVTSLKKVGRPALLMCFLPASFEIAGTILLAPMLLGVTRKEAAIIGAVIAAVSPAVIVPRMIQLIEDGYGTKKSIPQLILAGASVDDVFVIVVFTAFIALEQKSSVSATQFSAIPVSILLGIAGGIMVAILLGILFDQCSLTSIQKLLVVLSASFLMIELENQLKGRVPVSGLIAIMSIGLAFYQKKPELAKELSEKYNGLWTAGEILLFVLVGAAVDLQYVKTAGVMAIILVIGALVFRMAGVFCCMAGTELDKKERLFCMMAYTPKATVQAAIGTVPLSLGLKCGNTVLTAAILAILITAPFGAICIDRSCKKLLEKA